MQATLTSANYNRQHTINLVVREHEILLTTADGKEIGSIRVETSERDVQEGDRWVVQPSDDFFVSFEPRKGCIVERGTAWVQA